jgi:outer membrane lipoprotein SlyB
MQNIFSRFRKQVAASCLGLMFFTAGCARDLSSNVYTSNSTFNLVLNGRILKSRPVLVKNNDQLSHNSTGIVAGGIAGGAAGYATGEGGALIAAGVLAGALVGSLIESSLSTADGIEYIVQIDRSQLSNDYYEGSALLREAVASAKATGTVAIVQSKDNPLQEGQEVFAIISPKRARVVSK